MPESSLRHPLARALLALTFTTGLVDAVSFLGVGQVFTANMTGNVVFLGFGVAGGTGLPVVAPIVSLVSFLAGAAASGALARTADGKPGHFTRTLLVETVLIGAAAIVAIAVDVHPDRISGYAVIALLALAMGSRNGTVRRLGVPDLTTTVVTMTLTGLAAESPLAGGTGKGSARRTAAVASMFAGALVGALLLKTSLALPLVTACALALLTWVLYGPSSRRVVAA